MKRLFFLLLCLFLLGQGFLFSGPRWWWDDREVAVTNGNSLNPDVAFPVGNADTVTDVIFVVWQEIPEGETDYEIFLTASFDMGCSFCDPVQITENDDDDINPAVAAGIIDGTQPNPALMVHVVYEADVMVEASFNAFPIDLATDLNCAALASQGWSKAVLNDPMMPIAISPDIAAAVVEDQCHFHAVWQQADVFGGTEDDICINSDRDGAGAYIVPVNITETPPASLSPPRVLRTISASATVTGSVARTTASP